MPVVGRVTGGGDITSLLDHLPGLDAQQTVEIASEIADVLAVVAEQHPPVDDFRFVSSPHKAPVGWTD